jgi:hypothetical protein
VLFVDELDGDWFFTHEHQQFGVDLWAFPMADGIY